VFVGVPRTLPSETDISPKRQRCSDSSTLPLPSSGGPTYGASDGNFSRDRGIALASSSQGGKVPSATLSGELQTRCASFSGACLPSHLHTPLQGSALERSTYMLLGAPEGWLWTTIALSRIDRYSDISSHCFYAYRWRIKLIFRFLNNMLNGVEFIRQSKRGVDYF
jgi:hypothetical protein